MNWFNILKNLKGKGKSKGSTLDASKIKVNIQEECKEKLRRMIVQPKNAATHIYTKGWEQMPEEVACLIIKDLQNITLDSKGRKVENYMGYEVRYWNNLNKEALDLTNGLLVRCIFDNKMVFELYVFARDWKEWRKLL